MTSLRDTGFLLMGLSDLAAALRGTWPECRWSSAVGLLVLVALLGREPLRADPPAAAGRESPPAILAEDGEADDEEALSLPPAAALRPLAKSYDERSESQGLAVEVKLVPDAYRYLMAAGMVKLRKARYTGEELDGKLKELHKEHRSEKGKVLVQVTLSDEGGKLAYYFLQGKPDKHVELRQGSKARVSLRTVKPKLEFARWQVIEQPRGQKRRVYNKALDLIEKQLVFSFSAGIDSDDKEPVKLALGNFVRVRDRREEQRNNYGIVEGINPEKKQISTANWKDQIVSPFDFTFYPGEWEQDDLDPDVQAIFDWLEENG